MRPELLLGRRTGTDYSAALALARDLSARSAQEIADQQFKQLQAVWRDCVVDVVYYRNLVRSGMAPQVLESWADLQFLPLLTRKILQERATEFRRLSGPPEEYRMTGGSTGEPVRLGVWTREGIPQRVAKLVLWQRCGYTPGHRVFLIWGHLHLLGTGFRRHVNHFIRKAKDRLIGYQRADAYSLSPEKCAIIARQIIRFKPFGLIGYASALDYFVRVTEEFHAEFGRLGVKFVMPASEMSPHADTFDMLARVFRCPVVQEYGGVEFGQVAMQFAAEPFKVFHHLNYVEAINLPGNDDGSPCLALTSLNDRYFPLIRYVQGDQVLEPQRLPHGHVQSFRALRGRSHDVVNLSDGSVVHSMAIFHCIHQERSVLNIQLVLQAQGPKLRLVTGVGYDAGAEARIRSRLGQVSRQLENAAIEAVADVQTTLAGKRRWIVDERGKGESSGSVMV